MSEDHGKGTYGLGGGSYGLIGIGVGLASSHLGGSVFMSMVSGLFWPASLGYWLLQALRSLAA